MKKSDKIIVQLSQLDRGMLTEIKKATGIPYAEIMRQGIFKMYEKWSPYINSEELKNETD